MSKHYSVEVCEAFNYETDKTDNRKIKVECPSCKRNFAALCSKNTVNVGHSNYGCPDYDDWVSIHKTKCGKCQHEFEFSVGE